MSQINKINEKFHDKTSFLPILPKKLIKTRKKPNSFHHQSKNASFKCFNENNKNSDLYDYESPLREFAIEVREKHKENFTRVLSSNSSYLREIRKKNNSLAKFQKNFEDFYLKRDKIFFNNYRNHFIREHINEIIDQKGYLQYITKKKTRSYIEKSDYFMEEFTKKKKYV